MLSIGVSFDLQLQGTGVTVSIAFPPDTDTPGFTQESASKVWALTHSPHTNQYQPHMEPPTLCVCVWETSWIVLEGAARAQRSQKLITASNIVIEKGQGKSVTDHLQIW